jgi:hypothetical protein
MQVLEFFSNCSLIEMFGSWKSSQECFSPLAPTSGGLIENVAAARMWSAELLLP